MMTRDEILSIEQYCQEHNISHKKRLAELDIPFWNFYRAKRRYREEDVASGSEGGFIQLRSGGPFVPSVMPSARTSGRACTRSRAAEPASSESLLSIEIRTQSGTAMRIHGSMTPQHLRELILSSNVQP